LATYLIDAKQAVDARSGRLSLWKDAACAGRLAIVCMTGEAPRAIIDETTALLAEAGVRGATLRKIGARCGVNFARLVTRYGGKDQLLAACFADVVERDLEQLGVIAEELARVGTDNPTAFLWALCEDAGGGQRCDHLVLTELLLASTRPDLNAIFRQWLVRRHAILGGMATTCGIDPLVFDILGLILLMECGFAVSNYSSVTYRLIAGSGFKEAVARLSGRSLAIDGEELAEIAGGYYINHGDPAPMQRQGETGSAAQGKNQIIAAAAAILQEEGVDRLTNRAVARRAGVSLALTTYHFPAINELVVAGLRRCVEDLAATLVPDVTREEIRNALFTERRTPFEAPEDFVRVHRGWLQVSLMAARSPDEAYLGQLMRRHIGLLAYAGVDDDKRGTSITRTAATSFGLWSGCAYLVARAFPPDDQPFDFDAQAVLAGRCLLGIG
jgi:AcrR family transcriptional regulator